MADTRRLPAPLTDNWDWQTQAACRGMDITVFFHPPDERNAARERRAAAAKAICHVCPATAACRQHALQAREPYGIWGGLSENERASVLGVHSLRYPAKTDIGSAAADETVNVPPEQRRIRRQDTNGRRGTVRVVARTRNGPT